MTTKAALRSFGVSPALAHNSKALVRSMFLKRGIWIEGLVDEKPLLDLISSLRPKHTDRALERFGSSGDGGYVMPDDLDGIGGCVSPGVSTECSFDTQIADMGIDVFLADASVPGPPVAHERFKFSKLFFDTFNSDKTITIDDFCKDIAPQKDLVLQMDIEGAEYRVLNSASEKLLSRFRIMAIEFHDLEQLFTRFGFREINGVFARLLRTHNIVHIHPNNIFSPAVHGEIEIPPTMEFTFYRKDRANFVDGPLSYPHLLDAKNVEEYDDVPLPRCWYQ